MRYLPLFCLYALAVSSEDGSITCMVPPTEIYQEAVLTCNYPEDLNYTKKDFSVNYNPHQPIPDSVLDCWWLRGQMSCSAKPGILYQTRVSRTFTMTFSNVTPAIIGMYACQVANYNPNLFGTCQLEIKTGQEEKSDQSFKTLAIVLPVGLIVLASLVAVAVVFFLKHKGSHTAGPDVEEGRPIQAYEISVDNKQWAPFNYRLPVQTCSVLSVSGDVILNDVLVNTASPDGEESQPMLKPAFRLYDVQDMQPGCSCSVFIDAIPTASPERVTVNLQSGITGDTDIALHIDIRFRCQDDRRIVVLNTRKNGSWEKEERVSKPFPFEPNKEFNLEITAESSCYKISVDNKHLAYFTYDLPVPTCSVLSVSGDVILNDVLVKSSTANRDGEESQPMLKTASHLYDITGGMQPGCSVFINAIPTASPERVPRVKLQRFNTGDTVARHIHILFDCQGQRMGVVLNTRKNGSWGKEKRVSKPFPFEPNKESNLEITAESSYCEVCCIRRNSVCIHVFSTPFTHTPHPQPSGSGLAKEACEPI